MMTPTPTSPDIAAGRRAYRVLRTTRETMTVYATSNQEAIDQCTGKWNATDAAEAIDVGPLCPTCDSFLTWETRRTTDDGEEPTYCQTCDREVGDDATD